jgi:hypothetical protein
MEVVYYILLLLITLGVLVFSVVFTGMVFSSMITYWRTGIPFVPSKLVGLEEVLRKYNIGKGDRVIDMGSGDGRVLLFIAQVTGAHVSGWELSRWLCLVTKLKAKYKKVSVRVNQGNFMNADISQATVIYTYLYPFIMERIASKLLTESAPGTLLISRDFRFPDSIQPLEVIPTGSRSELYLYRV